MFYPSTPNPINPNRAMMLDPSSDLNHFNTEFPLMSSLVTPGSNGLDTSGVSSLDDAVSNTYMSPVSTASNPNSSLFNHNASMLSSMDSNGRFSNMNAGNSYPNMANIDANTQHANSMNASAQTLAGNNALLNNHNLSGFDNTDNSNNNLNNFNYGLSIDTSAIANLSPSFSHQLHHQDSHQSLHSSAIDYPSNDMFVPQGPPQNLTSSNVHSATDSSLLSTSSMNSLFDNDLTNGGGPSGSTSTSASVVGSLNGGGYYSSSNNIQPSPASMLSVNSYDFNNPSHPSQPRYDSNYTPPMRSRKSINDYNSFYTHSLPQQPQPQQQQPFHQSPMSSSSCISQQTQSLDSYAKREPSDYDSYHVSESGKKRYRVIRGVSAGGCSTRPPKQSVDSDSIFLPVVLNIQNAGVEDICYPKWSASEKQDRRRIIRIERVQNGPKLTANFSIVGGANENPETVPAGPDVDVVEVSCLECSVIPNEDYDSPCSDDRASNAGTGSYMRGEDGEAFQYYITSVEVVELVELLIGTQLKDPADRRRERGRVRSNLVPFWSKKSISSRMDSDNYNNGNNSPKPTTPTNQDFRVELAKRIMGYEIRKPRGFDKEVRILRWDKLVPALNRALQSYYTEIPQSDAHLEF